jgi:hypothetical protein
MIFIGFSVDLGMKTGNKLKDTQVYLMGNPKSDTMSPDILRGMVS